jgi:hypothetical protein
MWESALPVKGRFVHRSREPTSGAEAGWPIGGCLPGKRALAGRARFLTAPDRGCDQGQYAPFAWHPWTIQVSPQQCLPAPHE